uniref:Putative glycosyltransferase n=1 Tax=viral metagenome TaxID=1070528 RepID=A0A6M3JY11_9ZZZZ
MTVKKLIVTRSDETQDEIVKITHPNLKWYAKKCGADFEILTDSKGLYHHYKILCLYELFDKYDRILSLDSDILIMKDCPSLFRVVPKDKIGTIFEDVGSRKEHRRELIREVQDQFGDVGWTENYINTGVAIFSKQHKDIFEPKTEDEVWNGFGYDDIHLGHQIHKYGHEIYQLPYKYNHMSLFSEKFNGFKSRFTAYIVHYAGQAGFIPCKKRMDIIREDYLILKKYNLIKEI